MTTQELVLGSGNTINVTLKPEDKSLTEVVVTGYSKERKSQFVGSATVLSSKVVETVPVGSFDQALQGRAPGVQVSSSSGQPGASATISIRGVHSISGAFSQPLYVIDGVPLPANDMQTINPNDFESITILKDASAAALYGARGGLGVIVITTKKGKQGAPVFGYRGQMGITQSPKWNKFELMNTKEILQYEERLKINGTPGWNYSKNNPAYAGLPGATQARYDFLLDSIGSIDINYRDFLFRKGLSQSHEVNVSGGTNTARYYMSGSYFDQKGTDINSRLRRYTTRINLDFTAGKLNILFNNAIGYSLSTYSEGERRGNSTLNSFQMAWRAKPYENPYRPDGTIIFGASNSLALKQIGNLLAAMQNTATTQNQLKINSGLTFSYKLLPSVTLRNTTGIDMASDMWMRSINANSYIGSLQSFQSGFHSESYKINSQLINTSSIVFAQKFNQKHEVEAGGYFEVVRGWQRGLGLFLFNLDPRLTQTGQGAGALPTNGAPTYPQNSSTAKSGYGIRSYFATGRYTINANIRRDGTSRILNEDNKIITTWSAGAIWNAMQEGFMKSQNFLTDLRVRASYGAVPNIGSISTGGYGISGGLIGITNYLGPQIPTFGSTSYAGSTIAGQAPTTPGNPNLKIETIRKINIGTDFSIWKDRARFTIDYYNDKTEDLFVNQGIPATSGFGSGYTGPVNAGIMRNSGVEFSVNVDVVKTKNIDVTIGANHTINKNLIEDLGQVSEIPQGTFIIREGLPYGSHYTTHYLGADPATGRPRFELENGTETTNPSAAFQFAKYGTFLPKHVGGFNTDFRYKRFTVSAFFSYQFEVSRYNNIENWIRRGTVGYHGAVNAWRGMLTEQWQKPGDNVFYNAPQYDRGFNSSDIQDAKFLRFRNLNIAYNIPQLNVKGLKIIKSARIYAQGQNLAIWSPWRGPDPEDNNNISLNEFPNPRMFVAGIDINF